jgi:uncharacterized membrane protein
MKNLIRYFFKGLLIIAPAFLTIYIVYIVVTYIDDFIQSFATNYIHFHIKGLGIITMLVLVTLLGFIGQSIIFSPIRGGMDKLFRNAPLVKILYSAIRDLLTAFVGQEKKFNKPVLVKVNKISDLEKIGFITSEELADLDIKDKVAVYFPHSFNFSGELFIVPKDQIKPLNIAASEAMKFVISGGVTKV